MRLYMIMLVLFVVLNAFVIWRIHMWIDQAFLQYSPARRIVKTAIAVTFVLAGSALLARLVFPKSEIAIEVVRVGNYWLGFFIVFLACLLIAELLAFLVYRLRGRKKYSPHFYRLCGIAIVAAAVLLTVYGCVNARKLYVREHEITIPKKECRMDSMRVVLAADTHLGYSIGYAEVKKMVDTINALAPDVVLIGGDIFDNNYDALKDPGKLEALLRSIRSEYGVYAVYGNHDVSADLVGGFTVGGSMKRDPRMEVFLENSNVTVLEDESVTINNAVTLIGRLDGEQTGTGKRRKTLDELMKDQNTDRPLFMMNHEPVGLKSYAEAQVDVLFSGHTHAGQTFPLTLMNPFVWRNPCGCMKMGEMYSVVTSGVGVYGPYMRVFTRAEVTEVDILFQ